MKKKFLFIPAMALVVITACNNKKSSEANDATKVNTDTTTNAVSDTIQFAEVIHRFTDGDPKLANSLKTVVDHYLHIKNALVKDDSKEAATGGKEMTVAITKIDKSLFTAEQKKVYDGLADDLKENAEHIGDSGDDIEHQREHFSALSQQVYGLVKAFGGGQALFHDHCPMYNDNKGALWLSETKEIKNPYMGSSMPKCGKVMEKIQ